MCTSTSSTELPGGGAPFAVLLVGSNGNKQFSRVYGTDPKWSDLNDAQDCFGGDLGACDDLHPVTEVGSLGE